MTKGRRPRKTAAELMAELDRDPGYATFLDQAAREQEFHRDEYQQAAAGVLSDLHEAGYPVRSIGELRQSGFRYPGAIPVLVHWLPKVSNRYVKEDLIRTLSVPWAKAEAEAILKQEFQRLPSKHDPSGILRWTIGNALETMADRSSFDDLAPLAQGRQFGTAREMVVIALAKTKDPRAVEILVGLLDDPDVVIPALTALGKLKAQRARDAIVQLTDHGKPEVSKTARAALAKLDK